MGLFDRFKKQDCEICGKEVGIFGYKKLEDGEICKDCVKLLSPWFEDRRHSTVAQIKEQIAYRKQNEEELKNFQITRTLGDYEKIYIEEVNGVPTRFFVTQFGEGIEDNPDIISFQDVTSCVLDLDVHDEEMMQKDKEGNRVSYNPPRFQHHYNFIIRMEIRNNPYFDEVYFTVNSGVVTLETIGGIGGGIRGAALSGLMQGAGIHTANQTNSIANSREHRRYNEYQMMCEKIIQTVEDGKRGAVEAPSGPAAQPPVTEAPVQAGPKFCPNCGAPADGGKFCQHCGGKL